MTARIVFAGTPEFAASSLQALLDAIQNQPTPAYEIVGVYTQPDRPAGRGRKLTASPVKQLALAAGLPVFQPENFKESSPEGLAAQQELASLKPDLMLVVAYGLILPTQVLTTPTLGCVNVHASLLPAWRGAAPIQRAILNGDSATGVTLMQMDAGLDTGAMLAKTHCPIGQDDTSSSLHDKLALQGGKALVENLPLLLAGTLKAQPQDEKQATYAHKLSKAEAKLNWQATASQLALAVRGYNPWPVAWCDSFRVWQAQALTDQSLNPKNDAKPGTVLAFSHQGLEVACGEGSLLITRLQLAGKPQVAVADLRNGNPEMFQVGQVLA